MRILQICSARELGGGERHLIDLSNALASRGHEVYVALVRASPLLRELSVLPRRNILELPLRNSLDVASALELGRFARRKQIEIVHAHRARDYPLAALAVHRAGGAQLVITRHVLFPLSRIHKVLLRRVARAIAVSQAVFDTLVAQNVVDRKKIEMIHNGIDLDRFTRTGGHAHVGRADAGVRLCVGMIGELSPIKGQEDFLRAAAIVSSTRDDVDFLVAGEDASRSGENRWRLENMIEELGLTERVRITGWADDVARLLRTFDVFVSASHSESFGIAIVEAMACGVPVVATGTKGAQEIIDDEQTGRLVPIKSPDALAAAIRELLDDPETRKRLATRAQRVVRERFSLAQMVDDAERLYERVIGAAAK